MEIQALSSTSDGPTKYLPFLQPTLNIFRAKELSTMSAVCINQIIIAL